MYFSKNSRYVLQRGSWLSPSTFFSNSWRKTNRNLGVKYPQEDLAKPSLRVNIPQDSQQAEATSSKFSANVDAEGLKVESRSRSLISKKSSLNLNLEKNLLRKSESDTQFWDAEDEILSGSNFGKEANKEKNTLNVPDQVNPVILKSEHKKEESDYNEGLLTPLNEKSLEETLVKTYIQCSSKSDDNNTQEKTENDLEPNIKEVAAENKDVKPADSKTLYIIIDVPETKEKITYVRSADSSQEKETSPPVSIVSDVPEAHSDRLPDNEQSPKISKMKLSSQKGLISPLGKEKLKKDPSSWKPEGGKQLRNDKVEVHDIEDPSTYVFHLRFNKNYYPRSCKVGCVPEKEVNIRSVENNQNGIPIRARDLGSTKRFKNLSKELITVEDIPEIMKYSDMKKMRPKNDNIDKDRFKSWNYGSFKPDIPKNLKIKNEVAGEQILKKHLESRTHGQEFVHPQNPSPGHPQRTQTPNSARSQYFSLAPYTNSRTPQYAYQVKERESQSSVHTQSASQVQQTKSENSALPQHPTQAYSESYLSDQHASQTQEMKSEEFGTAQPSSQPQETNPEGSASVQHVSEARETTNEGSVSVENTSQPEQTNNEGSISTQNASPIEETNVDHSRYYEQRNNESSALTQNASQTEETDVEYPRYYEQRNNESSAPTQSASQIKETDVDHPRYYEERNNESSVPTQNASQTKEAKVDYPRYYEERNNESSTPTQNASQTKEVKIDYPRYYEEQNNESSVSLQNASPTKETNVQYPRYYEQTLKNKNETKPNGQNGTKTTGKDSTSSRSAINISKTYFVMPKSSVYYKDRKADPEDNATKKFNLPTSTDFPQPTQNLPDRKLKSYREQKDESKLVERKRTIKKYNKPVWVENKLRRTKKYTEIQFHSDSKSVQTPPFSQKEKADSDITDFKTSGSVSGSNYPKFGAAYPPLLSEAMGGLRRVLLVKKDSLFNHKWSSSCDSGTKNFELNPKCLSEYPKSSVFLTKKNSGKFESEQTAECLFEGKKSDILNVSKSRIVENCPKMSDNLVTIANENLTETKDRASVDSLAMMKKVKKMIDFDLNNAVKIFEGRDKASLTKTNLSSVLTLDGEKWKVNHEELKKCKEIQKTVTSNEINSMSFGFKKVEKERNKKCDQKTRNDSNLTKYLPTTKEKETAIKLEEDKQVSVVTYNPESKKYSINTRELENAKQRRSDEDAFDGNTIAKVKAGSGGKGSSHKLEAKKGDSILVFDEGTQSWKVDFSILQKRKEQIRQEIELRKTSEVILEAMEKMEQQVPNIQKPDSREKRVFDYKTEEWKVLPQEKKAPAPPKNPKSKKSTKSKYPFKESDAEEIRKQNADLYENLFFVKKETKMNKNEGKASKFDSTKESYNSNQKKKAKECASGSNTSGGNKDPPQEETGKTKNKTHDVQKDDAFWESFLKSDILPKSTPGLSKIKMPPNPNSQIIIEEPKPNKPQIKIEDPKIRIPPPFIGDKTIEEPPRVPPPPRKERVSPKNPDVVSQEELRAPPAEGGLESKNVEVVPEVTESSEFSLPPFDGSQKIDTTEETQKASDNETKPSPPIVEPQKIDNTELNTSLPPPVAAEKADDTESKTSLFSVEKKDDNEFKPSPPVKATTEKVDDAKSATSPPPVEAQKLDDPKSKTSPPPVAAKKADDTESKTSLFSVEKTHDNEFKSSPPVKATTEKVDDAKSAMPPTTVTAQKTKVSAQKLDGQKSKTSPLIVVSPKTKASAQKFGDQKSKTSPPIVTAQKMNGIESKPPKVEAQKTDDHKLKQSPQVGAQKINYSNSEPLSLKVKKADDLKLKPPSTTTLGSQKTEYLKSRKTPLPVGAKKIDDSKSEPSLPSSAGAKKDKSAADHYISENILEITRNSAKDKSSKVKPNKIETVKLNITSDKRMPSKITEINLNKKCEEKARESGSGSKKLPDDPKKPIVPPTKSNKCPVESNKFYRNFEKYKSSYSDPEYEEKPMKINSDNESNPNLKKLDHWNKTLVLQDMGKQPENIESWLKTETDKMATLLLKVLQEAADGKPKRKQMKSKSTDKLKTKSNSYYNIRKKQENTSDHFLIKIQSGNFNLEKRKKEKLSEVKKTEQKTEKSKREIPVQSENLAETARTSESVERGEVSLNEKASQDQMNLLIGVKPKEILEPRPIISKNFEQPNSSLAEITEDVPGPEILKKISNTWKLLPVLSAQLTIFTLFSIFQLVKAGTSFFTTSEVSKLKKHAFSKLFQKYGPIVNVQAPLSGNIIVIHKPEHLSAVFEQDASVPARSVFDSLEQSRKQAEERVNSIGLSTDWNKPKWIDLKRALNDPLERGCDKFFEPVDRAANALIVNIKRSRNNQNYVSHDFMEEIRSWSMEGLCNVLFEKSFSFLEGRSKNMNWILEPDKMFMAVEEATQSLSKCERGFHTWRLMPTPASIGLGQAYINLSSILSKQLYQADLNLKNKNEILNDGILINSRDMTFMESMLLNDGMTTDEITCNLIDIMLIGINMMSCTMGFLLYELTQNMRVQNKLLMELKNCLPDKDGTLDYQTINSLKYLQACIKESIRLHMPIPIFYRVLQNDILLSNYIISKGTYIVMDMKVSYMTEQNFEKPDDFIPERWLAEDKELQQSSPFAFFPFCHGPRAELAKRVVEMQLSTCAARVLRNFRVEYHHGNIAGSKNFISCPDKPLKLNFIDREE